MDPTEVLLYIFYSLIVATFPFSCFLVWCCSESDIRREEGRNAAAAALERLVVVQGQTRASAPAPIVRKELGYFPYSTAVEASGERLVCPICLEAFVRGAACSEVPACQHLFHRDCIGMWMKNGKSTCPLCRAVIVPGSGCRLQKTWFNCD
jgi:hypothetical protein